MFVLTENIFPITHTCYFSAYLSLFSVENLLISTNVQLLAMWAEVMESDVRSILITDPVDIFIFRMFTDFHLITF